MGASLSAVAVLASVLCVSTCAGGVPTSISSPFKLAVGTLVPSLFTSNAPPVSSASTGETPPSCTKAFTEAHGTPKLGNFIPCSSASGFCPSITSSCCAAPSTSISCCTLLGDSVALGSTSMHSSPSTAIVSCGSFPFSLGKPF